MTGTTETLQDGSASHVPYPDPLRLYSLAPYPNDHWTRAEARGCFVTNQGHASLAVVDVNSDNNGIYNVD